MSLTSQTLNKIREIACPGVCQPRKNWLLNSYILKYYDGRIETPRPKLFPYCIRRTPVMNWNCTLVLKCYAMNYVIIDEGHTKSMSN